MFLRSLRKIGMGAAARRRPSCECKVGVESLDGRVVPSTLGVTPGSPIVESGLNANLSVSADEFGHGFAALTTTNPFTKTSSTVASQLLTNLVGNTLVPVPGVTGTGTPNPLTLAYRLPATVFPGDVVVQHFQTGQVSDLLRYVDAFNPTTGTFDGWLLVYSDNTPETDGTVENAPADVGLPTPNFTLATQFASEFGVQGFDIIDYQPEQAIYSILSDGNLISSTGA